MTVSVEFSQKDIARVKKLLARYQGRPLQERLRRGTLAAARMLVNPIRAESPVKTGTLRKSVKASGVRQRYGSALVATLGARVGPTAHHAHLVVRGHRIVTPGGRDTGRRARANPFVDHAAASRVAEAERIVSRILFEP